MSGPTFWGGLDQAIKDDDVELISMAMLSRGDFNQIREFIRKAEGMLAPVLVALCAVGKGKAGGAMMTVGLPPIPPQAFVKDDE
jgi:hypothetical protein